MHVCVLYADTVGVYVLVVIYYDLPIVQNIFLEQVRDSCRNSHLF